MQSFYEQIKANLDVASLQAIELTHCRSNFLCDDKMSIFNGIFNGTEKYPLRYGITASSILVFLRVRKTSIRDLFAIASIEVRQSPLCRRKNRSEPKQWSSQYLLLVLTHTFGDNKTAFGL